MSQETREAILNATIDQISQSGEASVRLGGIAKLVGIKEPSIYNHFDNREDLIVAAHIRRFEINLAQTLQPFIDAISECRTADEFLTSLIELYQASFQSTRRLARATRAEIVGNAYFRSALRERLSTSSQSLLQPAIQRLREGQREGWIRGSLDIESFVYWNLANITGLLFPEILADGGILNAYQDLLIESVTSMVLGGN